MSSNNTFLKYDNLAWNKVKTSLSNNHRFVTVSNVNKWATILFTFVGTNLSILCFGSMHNKHGLTQNFYHIFIFMQSKVGHIWCWEKQILQKSFGGRWHYYKKLEKINQKIDVWLQYVILKLSFVSFRMFQRIVWLCVWLDLHTFASRLRRHTGRCRRELATQFHLQTSRQKTF